MPSRRGRATARWHRHRRRRTFMRRRRALAFAARDPDDDAVRRLPVRALVPRIDEVEVAAAIRPPIRSGFVVHRLAPCSVVVATRGKQQKSPDLVGAPGFARAMQRRFSRRLSPRMPARAMHRRFGTGSACVRCSFRIAMRVRRALATAKASPAVRFERADRPFDGSAGSPADVVRSGKRYVAAPAPNTAAECDLTRCETATPTPQTVKVGAIGWAVFVSWVMASDANGWSTLRVIAFYRRVHRNRKKIAAGASATLASLQHRRVARYPLT